MAPRSDEVVTRTDLRRALAVNAATKPLAIVTGAGIAVVALVLGATWLLAVAVLAYVALALLSFFDEDEAKRVGEEVYGARKAPEVASGDGLDRDLRERLKRAQDEVEGIGRTVAEADLPFAEVSREVEGLLRALEATVRRVQRLRTHLARENTEGVKQRLRMATGPLAAALQAQYEALSELRVLHDRGLAETEEVQAALSTVHARLVRAALADDEASDRALAGDVRELRQQVETLTTTLADAYT